MKKRILFVLQSLRMGGAERVQVTIANKLASEGYDVTILTWKPMDTFRNNLDPRVRWIYKAPDEHLGNRIPYIRHKLYDGVMWEERATPKQFYRYYVGREKYDVEIAFFHGIAVDIIAGSTNKKAKQIAWVHNNLERLETEEEVRKAKEMYRRIRHIVCVSKGSRESFINTIGDTGDVRVIYNMLPEKEILEKANEEPEVTVNKAAFHLVLVARFHAPKGYKRLIEAVVRLRQEGKDLSLALVGEGTEEGLIRDLIRENGAEEYISVVNGKNNPYPYIKESDLLVCASYKEGYNLAVAEAMILGVPVLSTDCIGPRELLDGGKYGMLTENSGEGLYNGLKQLYDSPELLEEYRKKALERRDFFDEDKIFAQIAEVLEG